MRNTAIGILKDEGFTITKDLANLIVIETNNTPTGEKWEFVITPTCRGAAGIYGALLDLTESLEQANAPEWQQDLVWELYSQLTTYIFGPY
jgi:hypothetical protein